MPVKAKWLNADQLDGYTATDFATADHAHTGTYAAATHDHDSAYAATDHGHDGAITLGGDASNHVAIVAEGAPANMVANTHYITEFAPLAPSAAQDGFSSTLIARLFRNSSHADDTYTNKVGLLYIDAHIELDKLGSNGEYV